jgi:hypothetical protein
VPSGLLTFSLTHVRNYRTCAVGEAIATDAAPSALGPYSQAISAGNTLYISGQIGFDPTTMDFAGRTVEDQTTQARILATGHVFAQLRRGQPQGEFL